MGVSPIHLTNKKLAEITNIRKKEAPNSPQEALVVKNSLANARDTRDTGLIPRLEDLLEKGMATHSSILA